MCFFSPDHQNILNVFFLISTTFVTCTVFGNVIFQVAYNCRWFLFFCKFYQSQFNDTAKELRIASCANIFLPNFMQRKNRKCDDSFAVINTNVVIVYRHFNEAFRDERCRDLEAVNTLPDGSFKSLYEGRVTTVSCPSSIKCNKRDKSCWHWVCMKKSLPNDLLTTGDARRDTSKSAIIRYFKIHVIHSSVQRFIRLRLQFHEVTN